MIAHKSHIFTASDASGNAPNEDSCGEDGSGCTRGGGDKDKGGAAAGTGAEGNGGSGDSQGVSLGSPTLHSSQDNPAWPVWSACSIAV